MKIEFEEGELNPSAILVELSNKSIVLNSNNCAFIFNSIASQIESKILICKYEEKNSVY